MTEDAKTSLRARMRRIRAAAHAQGDAMLLTDRLVAAVGADAPVAGYWPVRTEIDPRPAMAALAALGCALCLPVVDAPDAPLSFRRWLPGAAMAEGAYGIAIPVDGALVRPATLIVPLLAFDRDGWRLGYGGGFYDRTIAALRATGPVRAVGLAYAAQEVATVPHDVDDQPLDLVVTEDDLIDTGTGRACD